MMPKIIHQVWLGEGPMPDYRDSWQRHHPGWELKLWTDANKPNLTNDWLWGTPPNRALQSDMLRYEILQQYGGVYVDVDFECLRNIEPLLTGDFVMAYENPRYLQNGFIACCPNHPAMGRIIQEIPLRWQLNVPDSVISGPLLIDSLRRYAGFDASITKLPPGAIGPDSPDSYVAHRHLASWRPSTQIVKRVSGYDESRWGSHIPLLAGIWRQLPGETVVEAGIGACSTPWWVAKSLRYIGIESDRDFLAWVGIQFRYEPHVSLIPLAFTPGIPFHRGEATAEQVRSMDDGLLAAAALCPDKIDILMVDGFGASRRSALMALAPRATTVVIHDTECWDGYYYGAVLEAKKWRHRFSFRPKDLPWSDVLTTYPANTESIRWAVSDYAAPQYFAPGQTWEFVDLSGEL